MLVEFYTNLSDEKTYPKQLKNKYSVEGTIRDDSFSESDPVLIFKYDENILNSNYVYIPYLNMYYHITNRDRNRTGTVIVSLHWDPLMKYWEQIKENEGMLVRSELYGNFYIQDNQLPLQQNTDITYAKSYASPFTGFSVILNALNTAHTGTSE